MKPRIERIFRKQKNFVANILAEAEKILEEHGPTPEAGVHIFRAYRGLPKNNKLMKVISEASYKKLMQDTELEYLREKAKNMHIIDEELYFVIDEKNNSIELTEKVVKNLRREAGWKKISLCFLI